MRSLQLVAWVMISRACGGCAVHVQHQQIHHQQPIDEDLSALIEWEIGDVSRTFSNNSIWARPLVPRNSSVGNFASNSNELKQASIENRVFIFGAWHKSGTNLVRKTASFFNTVLNIRKCCNDGCRHPGSCSDSKPPASFLQHERTFFLCRTRIEYVAKLRAAVGANWRGVIVTRDPLFMLVSAYVYHTNVNNTWDFGGCDGEQMKQVGLLEGLRIQLKCTMWEVNIMVDAYRLSQSDNNLMVARFEDFVESSDSFDRAMGAIYQHQASNSTGHAEDFVAMVSSLDLRRNPQPIGAANHVSSKNLIKQAMNAVEANGLDRELRAARSQLRYIA
jgi:hypothetical protein